MTVEVAWDLGKLGKIQSGRKKTKMPQDHREKAREDVHLYFRFFAMADFWAVPSKRAGKPYHGP